MSPPHTLLLLLSAAALPMLFSCGAPQPQGASTLAGTLAPAALHVTAGGPLIALSLDSTAMDAASCRVLDGTSATMDRVPLPLVVRGAWHPGRTSSFCLVDCVPRCDPHVWALDFGGARADVPETTFVLSDGSAAWSMTVERLFAVRTLARVASGPLRAGETMALTWSQPSDVAPALSTSVLLTLADGGVPSHGADGGELRVDGRPLSAGFVAIAYDAGHFEFTVPENLPAGPYVMRLGNAPVPRVTGCVGPSRCSAEAAQDLDAVSFDVVP